MAHLNERSISVNDSEPTDFILYPSIVAEDGSLYPQYHPQAHYNTSTTEILYAGSRSPDVNFTALLGEEDSAMNSTKQNPADFYSLANSPSTTYPPQTGFNIISTPVDAYSFSSSYIPRTSVFNPSAAEQSTIDESHPTFLIHPPTFPTGYPGDYRQTPSASPATSIGGCFEGSVATHSTINSAIDSLSSARSSLRSSPYSVHEDLGLEQEQNINYPYIDPSELTTHPHFVEDPESTVASPILSPLSPTPSSNPASPTFPIRRSSPFGSGRSQPYPYPPSRRGSKSISPSPRASKSPHLENSDEPLRMRSPSSPTAQPAGRDAVCPECGKTFRDMRAHLLTHKLERPEKCPIATCEYSKKGFARKYDCQRHTLTHYKGTMVCGFCPCAGSPAEKSFNRADVFKRHLMSVHNVEQQPPNGRKKPGSASSTPRSPQPERFGDFQGSGKCSTCSGTFSTAQHFYEHLDDCVYSKVVQEEPAAAYNEMNMNQINPDEIAKSLMSPWKSRRSKSSETDDKVEEEKDEDKENLSDAEDDMEDNDEKDEASAQNRVPKQPKSSKPKSSFQIRGGPGGKVRFRQDKFGRDGITKHRPRRGSKKRKNFPAGWGCPPEQMISKRRCLMVYDGPSILCKDEMMMNTEWEVRASTGGDNFISDLDIWTMAKAKAVLEAGLNVEVR